MTVVVHLYEPSVQVICASIYSNIYIVVLICTALCKFADVRCILIGHLPLTSTFRTGVHPTEQHAGRTSRHHAGSEIPAHAGMFTCILFGICIIVVAYFCCS